MSISHKMLATSTAPRVPFGAVSSARIQSLMSVKNTQNAIPSISPKRKASEVENDTEDAENVDPIIFSKRTKGVSRVIKLEGSTRPKSKASLVKKPTTILEDATPVKAAVRSRSILRPKSPKNKVGMKASKVGNEASLTAPAGRSPTRPAKGRTAYRRIDPSSYKLASLPTISNAPFSLESALSGTLATRGSATWKARHNISVHIDSPEQDLNNLLQRKASALDLASDEELRLREEFEKLEEKENVPPKGYVEPIRREASSTRDPLLEIEDEELAQRHREGSVFLIPGDEDDVKAF